MALPGNFNTVQVRGRYVDFTGAFVVGRVTFTPTVKTVVSGDELTTVVGTPIIAELVLGQFAVQLPATDDPDIVPTNFVYEVTEQFVNLRPRTFALIVPISFIGPGIDIAAVAPYEDSTVIVAPYVFHLDGGDPMSTYPHTIDGGTP